MIMRCISLISWSEQAPGSEFQPYDKSEKNDCDIMGLSWCKKTKKS